jgi:hypothetical protein
MPSQFDLGSSPPLVVEDDVLDPETVAVNSRLAAGGAGGTHNPDALRVDPTPRRVPQPDF